MNNEYHNRKPLRLKNYDYSQAGYYFITICVQDKADILCRGDHRSPENCLSEDNPKFELSQIGEVAETAINNIPKYYSNISIDIYTIMPNHIHMILVIESRKSGRPMVAPTVSRVVQQLKGYVTKQIGYSFWQKSYYEHVIRNEKELQGFREYIYNNSLKWELDEYYS